MNENVKNKLLNLYSTLKSDISQNEFEESTTNFPQRASTQETKTPPATIKPVVAKPVKRKFTEEPEEAPSEVVPQKKI